MANKYSVLLSNLLKKTYADAKEKGRTEATFEDYLPRLFSVLNNYRPPMRMVPGELRGILGVREELDAVIGKASARSFDFAGMSEIFERFDREHPETRHNRETLFATLLEFSVTIAPDRATTAEDLWDAMVAYPSASVKQYIFGEAPADGEVAPPDPATIWRGTVESEGVNVGAGAPTAPDDIDPVSGDSVEDGFSTIIDLFNGLTGVSPLGGRGFGGAGVGGEDADDGA